MSCLALLPLLAKVYPNGAADVNHFEAAGGLPYITHQLRSQGMLNEDVVNVMGEGLDAYTRKPMLDGKTVKWSEPVTKSGDPTVVAPFDQAFAPEGGMRMVKGNLGCGIVKVSAVEERFQSIKAPCRIFDSQDAMKAAFDNDELNQDVVVVVRFQGPATNGMPELHKLTPYLGLLQDRGHKVALVTDGRMSGASGKVLAAIHVSPEARKGGQLAKLKDGDMVEIDSHSGFLTAHVDASELDKRTPAQAPADERTLGRGMFAKLRALASNAEDGASII